MGLHGARWGRRVKPNADVGSFPPTTCLCAFRAAGTAGRKQGVERHPNPPSRLSRGSHAKLVGSVAVRQEGCPAAQGGKTRRQQVKSCALQRDCKPRWMRQSGVAGRPAPRRLRTTRPSSSASATGPGRTRRTRSQTAARPRASRRRRSRSLRRLQKMPNGLFCSPRRPRPPPQALRRSARGT